MEFKTLKYFLAVCKAGTMSRAAEELHVTQPTLSRQIADLERELGCVLLLRHSRSVEPTEEGLYLMRRAQDVIGLMGRIESDFAASEEIIAGDISIGACESSSMRLVAACMRIFQDQHPHVRFRIHSGHAGFCIDRLERGLDDFALLLEYPAIDRYESIRLSHLDRWGCFIPENDPLANGSAVRAEELVNYPMLIPDQALAFDMLSSWFGDHLNELNVRATFNLGNNGIEMVREGMGYMLSLGGIRALGERTGLAFLPLDPPVIAHVDLAWCRGRKMSKAASLFKEQMLAFNAAS